MPEDYSWLLRGLEPEVRPEYLAQKRRGEEIAAQTLAAEDEQRRVIDQLLSSNIQFAPGAISPELQAKIDQRIDELDPDELAGIRTEAEQAAYDAAQRAAQGYQAGGIVPQFGGGNMNGISMSTQPARRRIRPENMRTGIGMGAPRNTFPMPPSQPDNGITMGSTDTVPAMLTPGEGVLNTGAMGIVGEPTLNALNRYGKGITMQGGGVVHENPTQEETQNWTEADWEEWRRRQRLAGGGAQSAGLRQLMDKYFGPPNSIGLQPDFVSDDEPVYASEGGLIEGLQGGGTAGRGGGRTTYYGPNMFGRYPGGSMPSLQDLNEIVGNRDNLLGPGARAYHPSEPGRGEDVHGVGKDVVDVYRPGPTGWGGFGNLPSSQLRESGLGGPISGNTLSQTGWSNRNTGNPGVYAPIPTWANRTNAIYGAGPRGTFGRGTSVDAGLGFGGFAGSGGPSLTELGLYGGPGRSGFGDFPKVIRAQEGGVVPGFAGGGVAGRPASWGTGKPTRDLIGMGIGGISNLLLPGLGFATSPLARYVTSLVQRGKWGSFAPNIPNRVSAPAQQSAPPPAAAPQAGYGEGSGGGGRGFEGLGGGGFEPLSGAGVGVPGYGGSLGPSSGYTGGQLGYSTSQGWNWKPWKDVGNLPTNPSQGVATGGVITMQGVVPSFQEGGAVHPIGYTDPIEEAEWQKVIPMLPPNADVAKLKQSGIDPQMALKLFGSVYGGFQGAGTSPTGYNDLAAGGGA